MGAVPRITLLALALVLASGALAGCADPATCRHIGEPCSNSAGCCPQMGLLCDPGPMGAFCSKTCRCHGGTGLCTPGNFDEGCPQGSVCLTTGEDGVGQCIVLCNESPCPPNHYRCGPNGDAGEINCVAVDAGAAPGDLNANSD